MHADEVESLTAARKAAVSGTEPSDAVRVVNALLTQIDKLSRCSNVRSPCRSELGGRCGKPSPSLLALLLLRC